jgi:hypothetical protein
MASTLTAAKTANASAMAGTSEENFDELRDNARGGH